MSLSKHQKWKIHYKIDVIMSIVLAICLIYLLPVIFFITKTFFKDTAFSETNLPETHNWGNFVLRISNDFWLGIINRIFGLGGSSIH